MSWLSAASHDAPRTLPQLPGVHGRRTLRALLAGTSRLSTAAGSKQQQTYRLCFSILCISTQAPTVYSRCSISSSSRSSSSRLCLSVLCNRCLSAFCVRLSTAATCCSRGMACVWIPCASLLAHICVVLTQHRLLCTDGAPIVPHSQAATSLSTAAGAQAAGSIRAVPQHQCALRRNTRLSAESCLNTGCCNALLAGRAPLSTAAGNKQPQAPPQLWERQPTPVC